MAAKLILLWDMPDELMLIVEHASGVAYQNQVGGVTCDRPRLEGVLAPVGVSHEASTQIKRLAYTNTALGISSGIADTIDALLAAQPTGRFLRVDRSRLVECQEAWIHVVIDSPEKIDAHLEPDYFGPYVHSDYHGSVFGFGPAKGVLTWINSD